MSTDPQRGIWFRRLTWLLIAVAIVRGLLIVASDPLLAVANNYDQIRVQACLGAFPDRDATIVPAANSPQAPYERFRFMPEVEAPCFLSSELLFAWAAWPAMQVERHLRADHSFSVRWKGGLQFVVWLLLAVGCTRRLISLDRADLALGHAIVCAVVVSDPGNFLYFNTFYAESSAILFCYALLVGVLVVLANPQSSSRPMLLAIMVAAFFLATAKIQHLIVPMIILLSVAFCEFAMRKPPKTLLFALAIGAAAGAGAQAVHMSTASNESIRSANLVDTLFMAMLPNASDPEILLAQLGLPDQCIEQSGRNWYSPGMVSRQHCPQVFELQQSDLLLASLRDPAMVARVMQEGATHAIPWIPAQLGLVEGENHGGLPSTVPSWNRLTAFVGPASLGLLAGLPVFAIALVMLRRSAGQLAANAVLLSVSILPLLVFTTSVFGDGYVELSKHNQLGTACLLAALTIIVCLLIQRIALTTSINSHD